MDGPRTVLLIDSDRDNLEICSALLAHFGFRVVAAEDLESGVRLARSSRPAVVVTELFARTGTGWSALEALRSGAESAGTPVIVLSVHARTSDREAASGAAAFLTKPVHLTHLLDQVRSACEATAKVCGDSLDA
jgi:DNA-binding response OmpR family regulator